MHPADSVLALLLRVDDVREVRVEPNLEADPLRLVRVVLHDDVLVEAVGDEAVAPDRHWLSALSPADDARREVVDGFPGQEVDRLPVDDELPEREVTYVLVEEALVMAGIDIARRLRVEERRAVEDRQVGHRRLAA